MIGNPVSMPRVISIVRRYNETAGKQSLFFVQVAEQEIMDWGLEANRNGHIACTQGGECLAGLARAVEQGIVMDSECAILDATAHAIKFSGFQDQYYQQTLAKDYGVVSKAELINTPHLVMPDNEGKVPAQGNPLSDEEFNLFANEISQKIAKDLNLTKKAL